jgi:hypothetical protein
MKYLKKITLSILALGSIILLGSCEINEITEVREFTETIEADPNIILKEM